MRELASVLDAASEVTTRIQGGNDGFVSRRIMLTKTLCASYQKTEQDILPASMEKDVPYERTSISRLVFYRALHRIGFLSPVMVRAQEK